MNKVYTNIAVIFFGFAAIQVLLYYMGKYATYILAGIAIVVLVVIIQRMFRRRW